VSTSNSLWRLSSGVRHFEVTTAQGDQAEIKSAAKNIIGINLRLERTELAENVPEVGAFFARREFPDGPIRGALTGTLLDAAGWLRPNRRQGWLCRMPDTNTIRVFLIDDHPVLRESLARALNAESGMVVVGQAGTAGQALHEIPLAKPDVVVVDLNIPDRDGIELLMVLHAQHPQLKLLVLSGYDDEYRVAEALRAGAQGYLVKTAEISEVVDGIRRIDRGDSPLSQRIAGAVVRAMRKPIQEGLGGLDALTPREKQVLRLLATGRSTREAAAQLTISPKTVETHRVRIYQKLGCKSAVELTRIAVRTGLIEA